MISSSVGSGHAGKYSYEIPHEYLSEWGNLLEKIIFYKRSIQSITFATTYFLKIAVHKFRKSKRENL